jgi:hypothetical protein
MRILCSLIACLWLLPLGCRAESSPSEEASAAAGGYEILLLDTETCPLPAGLDPADQTIVSYKVKLISAESSGIPVNYFYASLVTTDGQRYLADHPGCTPRLSGPPIFSGESATGYLNFPLPRSKTPEKVEYSPELLTMSAAESRRELQLLSPTRPATEEE